jgi:hypothetical protein
LPLVVRAADLAAQCRRRATNAPVRRERAGRSPTSKHTGDFASLPRDWTLLVQGVVPSTLRAKLLHRFSFLRTPASRI